MKKLLLLITGLIIFSTSACKKQYRCDCWIENQPHTGTPHATSVYTTKRKAHKECADKAKTDFASNGPAMECEISNY